VGADTLRRHLSPSTLCGLLAHVCGLRPTADAVSPAGLLEDFHWDRVREADQILDWDGSRLTWRSQTGGRLITRGKAFDS
jgi:hypothetical protein